jgi:hypothetical protein
MSSIFGGSQNQSQGQSASQSQSSNQAYPYLQGALSGTVGQGTQAGSQIANMLGLNGAPAQQQGFQNRQNSTGYQFGLNQGEQSVSGNAAAAGLLNSGATAKALTTYGQNYANTQYGNYTNQLQSLLGSGISAGSTIGNAGQQSTSQSQSTNSQNSSSKNNPFTSIFGTGGVL